jgi:hypothetical protein
LHHYHGSGTYISDAPNIEQVKNELIDIFGEDLYMVEGEVIDHGTF